MTQDFDYFLLLSVAAIVLVLWLIVRMLKGAAKKTGEKKIGHTYPQRRIERVATRTTLKSEPEIKPLAPKPQRVTGFYFKSEKGIPFAWVRLSSIGAQPWGNGCIELSDNLKRFTERFLKPQDNESLLISLFCELPSTTELFTDCFTDKGEGIGKDQKLGLTAGDFPNYSLSSKTDFDHWLLSELKSIYHTHFFRCSASEQAFLIGSENRSLSVGVPSVYSSLNFHSALAYMILSKITSETDFYKRARLWNFYWAVIETKTFPYTETLNTFERVVISQTFVQTQKLPFLLIQTPKGWGKCYNALNY